MISTQINLTEQEHELLQTIILKTGQTVEELIRHALDKFIVEIVEFDRKTRLKKMQAARGMWKHRKDLPDFEHNRRSLDRFPVE